MPHTSQKSGTKPRKIAFLALEVAAILAASFVLLAGIIFHVRLRSKKNSTAPAATYGNSVFTPRPPHADMDDDHKLVEPAWAAITVRQLNDLREKSIEALGEAYWTATMHDVNRAVLQPLCEKFQKPYAHIVNEGNLMYVGVFVSHCWAENFEQFVQSVNGAFQDWPVKPNLWICATALTQSTDPEAVSHQVGTGEEPSEAPFTKALAVAEKLLIVRNAAIDLYERIWCCWEFFIAYQLGMISRPGAVIIVGPTTFATDRKRVDVANAQASNLEDKRRILQQISKSANYDEINRKLTQIKFFDKRSSSSSHLNSGR